MLIPLITSGCAGVRESGPGEELHPSWIHYLIGDDLRRFCRLDGREQYRVIINPGASRPFQTIDVLANPEDGGAQAVLRQITGDDLDQDATIDPVGTWLDSGTVTGLSPRQFATLIYWLQVAGALLPPAPDKALPDLSHAGEPGFGFHWMVSGCRFGRWFFNLSLDRAPPAIRIRLPGTAPAGTGPELEQAQLPR